jgi:hypothetical protein
VVCPCNPLSKNAPIYFILLTKNIILPFNVDWVSGYLICEISGWHYSFTNRYAEHSASVETTVRVLPVFSCWEGLSEFEVEVTLRATVSRPVCLGVRYPSRTCDQFFFLLEISFRQLRVCYFVAPSLTRGRVCNLLYNCFWAWPGKSLLGRNPAELMTIFYCLICDSPNLEGQVPVFISPRNRVAQLHPRALGSFFVASYDSQGYGWGILTRLHTGKSEIFLLYHI